MSNSPDSQTGADTKDFLGNPTDDGWAPFVEHYGRTIRRWCQRTLRLGDEEADDLTQRVVVKLFVQMQGSAARWDPAKGRFHAWLKTVARNAWLDARAERLRVLAPGGNKVLELLEDDAIAEDFVKRLAEAECLKIAMARAQAQVPAQEWEVFRLRKIEQLSAREVAAQLGLSVGTIDNYTSKVRQVLQKEKELEDLAEPSEA